MVLWCLISSVGLFAHRYWYTVCCVLLEITFVALLSSFIAIFVTAPLIMNLLQCCKAIWFCMLHQDLCHSSIIIVWQSLKMIFFSPKSCLCDLTKNYVNHLLHSLLSFRNEQWPFHQIKRRKKIVNVLAILIENLDPPWWQAPQWNPQEIQRKERPQSNAEGQQWDTSWVQ